MVNRKDSYESKMISSNEVSRNMNIKKSRIGFNNQPKVSEKAGESALKYMEEHELR